MVSWQSDWPVDMVDILNAFYESSFGKVQNAMFWPPMMLVAMAIQPASKEWGWVAMMICDIQQISIRIFKCLASLCSPTKSQTRLYGAYPKIVAILFMYSCFSFKGYFVLYFGVPLFWINPLYLFTYMQHYYSDIHTRIIIYIYWVVVSNMFYFHPYLVTYFSDGWFNH